MAYLEFCAIRVNSRNGRSGRHILNSSFSKFLTFHNTVRNWKNYFRSQTAKHTNFSG
jgi:hypothetical protein